MESMENQAAGSPPFPHSLEIPSGIPTFPRSRLLAHFKVQEHERPNPRPLDLKGLVMEVLGPKCNGRSGTLTAFPESFGKAR